jgi:hypothetical protein
MVAMQKEMKQTDLKLQQLETQKKTSDKSHLLNKRDKKRVAKVQANGSLTQEEKKS